MFEGFERRRIDVGDATINCVTAGISSSTSFRKIRRVSSRAL